MVPTSGKVLRGDPREITDVLGENRLAAGHSRCKHGRVIVAGETEAGHRAHRETGCFQTLRQGGRIHLIQKYLHRLSAAAVSLRCRSMRA
ncbi:hypothetical protein MNVM_17900 [Mycobacterium novum]|uniref:Uncharacterized protein n=1 Tax=Mycobacterium novum TaxID=2492438 RepID=A0A7I7JMY1_9MYCO|nr:hypothetical protein MNVM_17900 [Mycobacterium novum]